MDPIKQIVDDVHDNGILKIRKSDAERKREERSKESEDKRKIRQKKDAELHKRKWIELKEIPSPILYASIYDQEKRFEHMLQKHPELNEYVKCGFFWSLSDTLQHMNIDTYNKIWQYVQHNDLLDAFLHLKRAFYIVDIEEDDVKNLKRWGLSEFKAWASKFLEMKKKNNVVPLSLKDLCELDGYYEVNIQIKVIKIGNFFRNLRSYPNFLVTDGEYKENRGYEYYYSRWLDYDSKVRIKPEFDQFIYSHIIGGELGNQMYRFASLYAMGQLVNRTPVYYKDDWKMHEMDTELAEGFPNFHRRIYFLKDKQNENEIDQINGFEKGCCDYADSRKLFGYERPLLKINGFRANFENSKYFHHIRPKIIELFEFGEKILENVNEIIQREFKLDNAYKICVHTRNGDFAIYGESKAEQVGPAIDRIIGHLPSLTNGKIGNYSLLLFGLDQQLLHSLKYNTKSLQSTYYIAEMKISRIGEFYLAKQMCNAFLATVSLSSFAFWMGYLMPESTPKFFIRKYIGLYGVQINTFDQLPSEWFPIEEDWLRAQ